MTELLPDDNTLLRAVAVRDQSAFQQLYDRHASSLFSLALAVLGDRADAEDVLQEAFVQVWKNAASYDERRGQPLGWLIMLTRSRAIDRLRSRRTRSRAVEAAAFESVRNDEPALPADQLAAGERGTLVRHVVQSLPAEQRTPIELAYFGGLTQTEIAQQLGQPLGTVKTRMRTGMMRLREQLTELSREDTRP